MSGPSILQPSEEQLPDAITPELIKKLQKDPTFVSMMKQQEEKRISDMNPREKLRARLRQKQVNRKTMKVKEELTEGSKGSRKKQTKRPE